MSLTPRNSSPSASSTTSVEAEPTQKNRPLDPIVPTRLIGAASGSGPADPGRFRSFAIGTGFAARDPHPDPDLTGAREGQDITLLDRDPRRNQTGTRRDAHPRIHFGRGCDRRGSPIHRIHEGVHELSVRVSDPGGVAGVVPDRRAAVERDLNEAGIRRNAGPGEDTQEPSRRRAADRRKRERGRELEELSRPTVSPNVTDATTL